MTRVLSAMNKITAIAVLAGAFVSTASLGAVAASVEPHVSPVYVNKGRGFQVVTTSTRIGPGDTVMTKDGGRAEIIYDDGCRVRVEPGAVASVRGVSGGAKDGSVEASPCKLAAAGPATAAAAPGAALAGAAGAGSAFGVAAISAITIGMGVAVIDSYNNRRPISP
jgi:hypothetical protein